MSGEVETSEYVVGVWEVALRAVRACRIGRYDLARSAVRWEVRYLAGQARRSNWRAVRNATVKPYRCESIGDAPRCGWGWTPAGARRSLERRLAGADR